MIVAGRYGTSIVEIKFPTMLFPLREDSVEAMKFPISPKQAIGHRNTGRPLISGFCENAGIRSDRLSRTDTAGHANFLIRGIERVRVDAVQGFTPVFVNAFSVVIGLAQIVGVIQKRIYVHGDRFVTFCLRGQFIELACGQF